jgi:DNA-binding GntR family transcriptional regulator
MAGGGVTTFHLAVALYLGNQFLVSFYEDDTVSTF